MLKRIWRLLILFNLIQKVSTLETKYLDINEVVHLPTPTSPSFTIAKATDKTYYLVTYLMHINVNMMERCDYQDLHEHIPTKYHASALLNIL